MIEFIASFHFPAFPEQISLYGFFAVALVLLGLICFDMTRARAAARNSASRHVPSRFRQENGMSVFFDTVEDPSERSARQRR